jgi:DNA-binding NarL/FixJ family response regulator
VTSILIIDDHAIVRRGIRQTLRDDFRDIAFGEARNGREGMIEAAKKHWDLIILDASLPDRDGFSLLRQITAQQPRVRVLMLGIRSEARYASQAWHLGAFGYLSKEASLDRFVAAVRSVLDGRNYFGHLRLTHDQRAPAADVPLHTLLSVREREGMLSLVAGKSLVEIAGALSLSIKTVSTFKRRLLKKLGGKSLADLVRYAVENGL